ncbi:hypothetical protein ABZ366_34700, partial [Streptomyces sp. NPDC005904]
RQGLGLGLHRGVEPAHLPVCHATKGDANVLPPMKDALRARATVGEVCDALRAVWGVHVPVDAF